MSLRSTVLRIAADLPPGDPIRRRILIVAQSEHHPGEVWRTDSGRWRAMSPKGKPWSFEQKQDAELYAKGKRPEKSPKGEKGDTAKLKQQVSKAFEDPEVKKALDDWDRLAEVEKTETVSARAKATAAAAVAGSLVGAMFGGGAAAAGGVTAIPGALVGAAVGAVFGGGLAASSAGKAREEELEASEPPKKPPKPSGLDSEIKELKGSPWGDLQAITRSNMFDSKQQAAARYLMDEQKYQTALKKHEEWKSKKASAADLKKKILDAIANPTPEMKTLAKKVDDGKGGLDRTKLQREVEKMVGSKGKTASIRTGALEIVASLPKGHPTRRQILAALKASREEHKPGDVWRTEGGKWRSKRTDGESKTFDNEEQARNYAKTKPKPKIKMPSREEVEKADTDRAEKAERTKKWKEKQERRKKAPADLDDEELSKALKESEQEADEMHEAIFPTHGQGAAIPPDMYQGALKRVEDLKKEQAKRKGKGSEESKGSAGGKKRRLATAVLKIAASLPAGHPTRREILAALKTQAGLRPYPQLDAIGAIEGVVRKLQSDGSGRGFTIKLMGRVAPGRTDTSDYGDAMARILISRGGQQWTVRLDAYGQASPLGDINVFMTLSVQDAARRSILGMSDRPANKSMWSGLSQAILDAIG